MALPRGTWSVAMSLCIACVLVTLSSANAGTIYVDDDAPLAGNGASWQTAYRYLQDALWVAGNGDEIHVAQGTYTPDRDEGGSVTAGDRAATFYLIYGVSLYGGYAGVGAVSSDERDVELYETILSGDLNGNDVEILDPADLPDEPTRAENSYHIVTGSACDQTTVLDGFTITGGNASSYWSGGGGMYNYGGSPTVSNCVFTGNRASRLGGAMHNRQYSSPTITGCVFAGNIAASSDPY
ncbi:unnamed protein product, partial [marine sediment metagenome]